MAAGYASVAARFRRAAAWGTLDEMRCRQHVGAAICSVALALGGAIPAVHAQSPATSASARAVELFEEGRRLYEAQQYPAACDKLAASDRLEPAVGTSGLYAACEEKLGHLASAYAAYVETAERARRAGDSRAEYASGRAAALQGRLPRLRVQLSPGAPPGTIVLRDGVELNGSSLGVELPVDPGAHALEARAPGRAPSRMSVALVEAERRTVTLEVGPATASPAAVPPSAALATSGPQEDRPDSSSAGSASNPMRTAAWIAGGVGLAGVAVAVVSGIVVLNHKSEMDDLCPESPGGRVCSDGGVTAREDVRPWLTANTIGWIVGGAGLGLGTVLFILSSGRSSPSTAAATATLSATHERASVTLRGHW
jgi:hypothetical protein